MTYNQIIINTDGGSRGNPGPSAVGITAVTETGELLFEISEYIGHQTNNVAEYTAVIHALNHLLEHKLTTSSLLFVLDSELIVRQITGRYQVKEPTLKTLNSQVKNILLELKTRGLYKSISFENVLREKNKRADFLVNQALDNLQ